MKNNSLIIKTIFVILFTNVLSYAQPQINNMYKVAGDKNEYAFANHPIVNDLKITIQGVAFGEKKVSEPMVWEDFEVSDSYNSVVIAGENRFGKNDCDGCWSDYAAITTTGTEPPKYSNLKPRGVSKMSSRHHFVLDGTCSYSDSWLVYEGTKDITGKLFVSFWVNMDWGNTADPEYQWKIMRVLHKDHFQVFPQIMLDSWKTASVYDRYYVSYIPTTTVPVYAPIELKLLAEKMPFGDRVWGMCQMVIEGGAMGTIRMLYFNPTDGKVISKIYDGPVLQEGYWRDFLFGASITNIELGETIDTASFFDDIYIDDSWARIEIGDASDYDACTHREMQIPIKWNPRVRTEEQIEFKVNRGSFLSGQKAYLFVINNDGEVSAGKEIWFQ